ncbi:glucosaminidase domain-containing protein [Paenibacillus glycanilyticus]|uniref:glucosaminidase domain-containing protein n=1 Tax=Paenibacillus glycanilyticus TaxID=126569 RepID=UPI0020424786|nr:glucosaminidase domain-containing protein [Paenibacillus glycanilyticus]MCM3626003.1 glucosaminidase domain-containing protein [Paenibacillus glycanilyticus]
MAPLTRMQFIASLVPTVEQVRREGSPIFPSVRLAQCLLETGGVIHRWYNLGGIKVGGGIPNPYWHGEAVVKGTWEVVDGTQVSMNASFRAYSSVYHFMKDQDLLFSTSRYLRVRAAVTPEQQANMLYVSGYATDPAYPNKLITLINQYSLKQYDNAFASSPASTMFRSSQTIPILVDGLVAAVGYYDAGTTWVAARALGESLGAAIGWSAGKVTVNGQPLDSRLDISTGYVAVRDLAAALNRKAVWEQGTQTVTLKADLP